MTTLSDWLLTQSSVTSEKPGNDLELEGKASLFFGKCIAAYSFEAVYALDGRYTAMGFEPDTPWQDVLNHTGTLQGIVMSGFRWDQKKAAYLLPTTDVLKSNANPKTDVWRGIAIENGFYCAPAETAIVPKGSDTIRELQKNYWKAKGLGK